MPTPALFQFYLMPDDTHWFYLVGNSVGTSEVERPIVHAPDKWEETELQYGRSRAYWGVLRKASMQYGFVKDGAAILRFVYYSQGVEGKCKLVIKKRNSNWTYDDFYSGEIDFSETVDSFTNVVANILEGGLIAMIKAYENTPFEIPIEIADSVSAYMDGVFLRGKYNWLAISSDDLDGDSGSGIQFVPDTRGIGVYAASTTSEGDYPIAIQSTETNLSMQAIYTDLHLVNTEAFNNFMFEALEDMAVVMTLSQVYTINYTLLGATNAAKLGIYIRVADENHTDFTYSERIFYDNVGALVGTPKTLNINVTSTQFNLTKGQRVYLIFHISTGNSTVTFNEGQISLSSTFRLPGSRVQGYRFHQLLPKLISKLTGGFYSASSSYFTSNTRDYDCKPSNIFVTCGDALRLLNTDSTGNPSVPKIKTSLAQLYKTARSAFGLGLGVESNVLVLEKLDYFFDGNTQMAHLGEANFPEVSPMTDLFGTAINIGYNDQTYDTLNGKDEFNTMAAYTLPMLRKPQTLDLVSEYRADMYGMEILRANLSKKKTTDSNSDNDTFMFELSDDQITTYEPLGVFPFTLIPVSSYKIYRPQTIPGNSASGLLFPDTAFPLTLTPGRNARRNGKYLAAVTHLISNKNIGFQTISKNGNLVSDLGSGAISERADIAVNDLPAPLFLPILIKFEVALANLAAIMASNPKGYFGFTIKGNEFKGFIDDVGVRPGKLDTYQFSLLLHPDTDLQLLAQLRSA